MLQVANHGQRIGRIFISRPAFFSAPFFIFRRVSEANIIKLTLSYMLSEKLSYRRGEEAEIRHSRSVTIPNLEIGAPSKGAIFRVVRPAHVI